MFKQLDNKLNYKIEEIQSIFSEYKKQIEKECSKIKIEWQLINENKENIQSIIDQLNH